MNDIQNYGSVNVNANYGQLNNKLAFKANISEPLKNELLKGFKLNTGKKYSGRLTRRLEKIPVKFTVEDIDIANKGTSFVRLNYNGDIRTFEISGNGSKLDIIEGLLRKDKNGTSQLSEFAYRLFGI